MNYISHVSRTCNKVPVLNCGLMPKFKLLMLLLFLYITYKLLFLIYIHLIFIL